MKTTRSSSKLGASEARRNIIIRLIGVIFLLTGLVAAYLTSTTPLLPQLSPVFYFISLILILSGGVALIARLE